MASAAKDLRYRKGRPASVDGNLARSLDFEVRERELRHAGEAPRRREAAREKPKVHSLPKVQLREAQHVAPLAVVGAAGYYYLARTGHESGVSVSTVEIVFRNDLENLLLARPRTKEFLVAFPGIMLAVYCAVRRMPFFTAVFGLAGTIGMTSVCNTFMHIRTPLYLGFVRTAYSLLLGILVGVVMIAGFELLLRLYRVLAGKFGGAERK